MKSPVVAAVGLVSALTLLTLAPFGVALESAALPSVAQEPDPLGPVRPGSTLAAVCGDDCWVGPDGRLADPGASTVAPQSTGGPDAFGYRWDDSVALDWIDATRGTNTGLSGEGSFTSITDPIPLGFPFPFYERTYTEVTISSAGGLGFDPDSLVARPTAVPSPRPPNAFIAPYLGPLWLNSEGYEGQVYTLRGGTEPNRIFVVEWHRVGTNLGDRFTFQAVLRENGDVLFQYLDMDRGHYCPTVSAIEAEDGLDGLAYLNAGCNDMRPVSGKAVLFRRPAPAPRVVAHRRHQGAFTRAGSTESFQVLVRNTGDVGPDVYDVAVDSTWSVALTGADGRTPLADTDGDGAVDTGEILQGGSTTVTVEVATPPVVSPGDANAVELTFRSSLDSSASDRVMVRTAVPAPFAQVYRDGADDAMRLDLIRPDGQTRVKATPDGYQGQDMAVAETGDGFVYTWYKRRVVDRLDLYEIEYALYDRLGRRTRGVSKLTDHTGATMMTRDLGLAVAVAPDGSIGFVWQRRLLNPTTWEENCNAYYAVLDASGELAVPATNLTHSTAWESG